MKYKLPTHTLQATCGTLLTSEDLLSFPFRLERTPYSHLASKVRYFHVTPCPYNENKHLTLTLQARCGTFLSSAICN